MGGFVGQLKRSNRRARSFSIQPLPSSVSLSQASEYLKPVRRESRITTGGVVYALLTLFLAIGAINSQNNLLFWLFGVSIATLFVSGIFSGNALMQVRLKAQGLPEVYAGEKVRLQYSLLNRSRFFPLFAAMISEIPDHDHPAGRFEPAAMIHLGPGKIGQTTGLFVPSCRGHFTARSIRLSTRFPFGLLQKSLIFECPRPLMVLPYRLALRPELIRVVHGRGEEVHKRTNVGGGTSEYWGLREYVPGDPKRSIAWKHSARLGKMVVVEHAMPIATKLWVWIRVGDAQDQDVECALAIGASLVHLASLRGVPVGLWVPSLGVHIEPGGGKAHTLRCLRALGLVDLEQTRGEQAVLRASSSDDVLVINASSTSHHASGALRVLETAHPKGWLVDPDTLPKALGGMR